jgi:hypothetical protein
MAFAPSTACCLYGRALVTGGIRVPLGSSERDGWPLSHVRSEPRRAVVVRRREKGI